MQLEFHYPKDQLYLVAVSGGPDSMALLDLLFQNGYALIVAPFLSVGRFRVMPPSATS